MHPTVLLAACTKQRYGSESHAADTQSTTDHCTVARLPKRCGCLQQNIVPGAISKAKRPNLRGTRMQAATTGQQFSTVYCRSIHKSYENMRKTRNNEETSSRALAGLQHGQASSTTLHALDGSSEAPNHIAQGMDFLAHRQKTLPGLDPKDTIGRSWRSTVGVTFDVDIDTDPSLHHFLRLESCRFRLTLQKPVHVEVRKIQAYLGRGRKLPIRLNRPKLPKANASRSNHRVLFHLTEAHMWDPFTLLSTARIHLLHMLLTVLIGDFSSLENLASIPPFIFL